MQVNIYLSFNGNCEDAMNFYKQALEGKIESLMRFSDAPMPSSDVQKNKVLHGVLEVDGTRIYFSDTSEQRQVNFGDNFSVSLSFKSDGDMTRAFDALSTGGIVTMPLQDMFWNARFGMCTDRFGVNWMFNFDKPKP